MTSTTIVTRRIAKAQRAMNNAQNPKFKEYWQRVIDQLSEGHGG
jgi:hypothetical protein